MQIGTARETAKDSVKETSLAAVTSTIYTLFLYIDLLRVESLMLSD